MAFRFALSRAAVWQRVCPPPLHVGLGKSPRRQSARRQEIAWLARNPNQSHRLRLKCLRGRADTAVTGYS